MGTYRIAQICLNGHMITDSADVNRELQSPHCSDCGAKTIMNCPECNQGIRGDYFVEGVYMLGTSISVPAYCHQCGNSYPWTEAKLKAAEDLVDELDELTPEEREQLKGTFADLTKNGPQTEVAGIRFKKILAKVGNEAASLMRKLVVDIASETAKKVILDVIK